MRSLMALLVLLVLGGPARADWPMPRHDPQRTGLATGQSNLQTPGAYWRYYLGGQLDSTGARLLDIDGDGHDELLLIRGGRLVALRSNATEVWESAPLALIGMEAIADLDGDGKNEAIVYSNARTFVVDLKTGSTLWAEDPTDLGTLGAVRVIDVNGDGHADVVVQECGCCKLTSGNPGFAYSFAGGFAAAVRLYTLPRAYCGGTNSLTIFDGVGDGQLETLSVGGREIEVLDAKTGTVLADSPDLGDWIAAASCTNAALDSVPGDEIVCYLSSAVPVPSGTGHRVLALRYTGGTAPAVTQLWTRDVGDVDAALAFGANSAGDLDGDGTVEITVSGQSQNGAQILTVLDGATGTVLATVSGQRLVGVGPLDVDGGQLILTDTGSGLAAVRFRRAPTPTATVVWTLPDRRVLNVRDWVRGATQPLSDVLPLVDLDGDGAPELLVAGRSSRQILAAVHTRGAPITELATYGAAVGAQMNLVVLPTSALGTGSRLAAVSSDGLAALLDQGLLPSPTPLHIGGYYAAGDWGHSALDPVIGSINSSTALLLSDSRGWLSRVDPGDATNIVPPRATWTVPDAISPTIIPGLVDGAAGIAACTIDRTFDPPREGVLALDAVGHERWHTTLGDLVFGDLTWGKLDDDPSPAVAVLWGQQSDNAVQLSALAGATGVAKWTRSWSLGDARFPVGTAIADWDGDQRGDVVFQYYGTRVIRGATGADLATGGPIDAYFMPTIYDVDGDNVPEVTLSGGLSPLRTLRADLATPVWTSTEDERPYPYAAIVTCPSPMPVPLLASTSLAVAGRLKFTIMSGSGAGAAESVILAGGMAYPDLASATFASGPPGQLTSVYAHADLGGDGQAVAVVGSSDGWLYAVKACTRELAWSVHFGAPVGAVAFGDIDGDGLDEVVVEVADGYTYGLRNAPLAAPDQVWDTDPPSGLVTEDVDERANIGQLSAAWDPVPGATSYEVAVAQADGTGYLTDPAWQSVGSGTSATIASLPLVDGPRYVFAVRALGVGGRSPDIVTDGVVVTGDLATPQPAATAGGCCQIDRSDPKGTFVLLALTVLALFRPKRHRRR